jgi:hypothetical protein
MCLFPFPGLKESTLCGRTPCSPDFNKTQAPRRRSKGMRLLSQAFSIIYKNSDFEKKAESNGFRIEATISIAFDTARGLKNTI